MSPFRHEVYPMYRPKRGLDMNPEAASALRDVFGAGAAKKIARRFGVAIETANNWLDGLFPESRTEELAAVVREDLARRETQYAAFLTQIGTHNENPGSRETRDESERGAGRKNLRH